MRELQLPAAAQEVADVIGRDAVLMLYQQWPRSAWVNRNKTGGDRERADVYVPRVHRLKPEHRLVTILGLDLAVKLCGEFGGSLVRLEIGKIHFAREEATIAANDNRPAV